MDTPLNQPPESCPIDQFILFHLISVGYFSDKLPPETGNGRPRMGLGLIWSAFTNNQVNYCEINHSLY